MDGNHHDDEDGTLCFGCIINNAIEAAYSEDNPVDPEEAIPVLTEILAALISSYDHREDRRAATADVVRWLKDSIKQQTQAPARVRVVSGVVH